MIPPPDDRCWQAARVFADYLARGLLGSLPFWIAAQLVIAFLRALA